MTQQNSKTFGLPDVSRETEARLQHLLRLTEKWNPAINLVGKSTLAQGWQRHILDSAQIFALAPPDALHWADLGSGGGYPGLVVAILSAELAPTRRVTLVESDQRKATFLRQAARELGLSVSVLAQRIEAAPALAADVISARALAALTQLCAFAERHLAPGGLALFPKGAAYAAEMAEARQSWAFDASVHPSLTDPTAAVLALKGIRRV